MKNQIEKAGLEHSQGKQRNVLSSRDRGIEKTSKPVRIAKNGPLYSKDRISAIRQVTCGESSKNQINRILSSIYFDLNRTCYAKTMNNPDYKSAHLVDYNAASDILDKAISSGLNRALLGRKQSQAERDEIIRAQKFVSLYGWKALSICAFSVAFRISLSISHTDVWERLGKRIARNTASFGLFADMRGLEWEELLIEHGLQDAPEPLSVKRKGVKDHPHHWVVRPGKEPRLPTYKGYLQENVEENIFDDRNWPDGATVDPTLRIPEDGPCVICKSLHLCDCKLSSFRGTLVELREYKEKGVGVRALYPIKQHHILGQFVGEIKPITWKEDLKYSLIHERPSEPGMAKALISPCRYGNWTRFINHSCNPSTRFLCQTVGRHSVMVIYAERDISAFEEITVDYGSGYLEGLDCKCGSRECVSLKPPRS